MHTQDRSHSIPLPLNRDRACLKRIAVAAALLTLAGVAQANPPAFSEAAYRKHIEVLSSDAFEGRAPGTEGEKKTLAYIEQQFRAAGLASRASATATCSPCRWSRSCRTRMPR